MTRKSDRLVADGRTWKRVKTPKPWKPKKAGDVLTGLYLGTAQRNGANGPYEVVLVKTDDDLTHYVSGVVVQSLFLAAGLQAEDQPAVRLVFQGLVEGASGSTYKDFDLYVADETKPLRIPKGSVR